jgi:hypothetical protein
VRTAIFSAAALGLTIQAAQQPPVPANPDLSVPGVVAAAAAYVKAYQEQLTLIIADEAYTQQIRSQIPDDRTTKTRSMKSEMYFITAPAGGWMAIRDVVEVDRKPVAGRQDLKSALETLPAAQVAGTFKAANSRFNIGRTQRNFNEPILSLLVLDARYLGHFSFERKKVERRSGETLVTIGFTETTAPTLIRDLQLRPAYSKGELTVEAATGRIRRAQLGVTLGGVTLELTTTFGSDERLGVWVPIRFEERYEEGVRAPGSAQARLMTPTTYEEIVCEARYSNYRRFETTARIK